MKILYLRYGPDYGCEFLLDGLIKVLGRDSVTEFPGFDGENSPWPFLSVKIAHGVQRPEDVNPDLIVVGSMKGENLKEATRLCTFFSGVPLVVVDSEDDERVKMEKVKGLSPRLYFLREYRHRREYPDWVHPLPFSWPGEFGDPSAERTIDALFIGSNNHPLREHTCKHLHAIALASSQNLNVIAGCNGNPFRWEEFTERLHNSKVGVSVQGFGYDTVRFWEVLASGAMLVADDTTLAMPHPVLHEKHAYFVSENTLWHAINHYTYHHDLRLEIATRGQEHLRQYHTSQARAAYFLGLCETGGVHRSSRA